MNARLKHLLQFVASFAVVCFVMLLVLAFVGVLSYLAIPVGFVLAGWLLALVWSRRPSADKP
jgi:hypothetical protein